MIKKNNEDGRKVGKTSENRMFYNHGHRVTMIMAIIVKCDKDKAISNDPNNDDYLKKIS